MTITEAPEKNLGHLLDGYSNLLARLVLLAERQRLSELRGRRSDKEEIRHEIRAVGMIFHREFGFDAMEVACKTLWG